MEIKELLLVNNNQADFAHIQALLSKNQFFHQTKLYWAQSYQDALQLIEKQYFDIYLFDYALGRYNGIDLLTETTQARTPAGKLEPLPVILTTTIEDQNCIVQAMKEGASDCLIKNSLSEANLTNALQRAHEKYKMRSAIESHRLNLENLNMELLHKNKEIQAFYYTLSHELKTPLTSAREFVSIILDGIAGAINETQEKYLSYVKESCDQLAYSINDLLDATRLDTGKLEINCSPQSIYEVIEHAVMSKSIVADQKNISLMMSVNKDLPPVIIDTKRMIQVLSNLIDNAIKFTANGGLVNVEATYNAELNILEIKVQDNGRGIPEEHIPYIFDRLYQVQQDDAVKEKGLGLGLNICRELIHLHHGKIWLESTVNAGSVFYITIPVSKNN